MKNIKKIALYAMVIIFTMTHHNSCAAFWGAVVQFFRGENKPAFTAAIADADKALTKHIADVKALTELVSNEGAEISKVLLSGAVQAAAGGVVETAKVLAPAAVDISKSLLTGATHELAEGAVQTATVLADGSIQVSTILADGTTETARILTNGVVESVSILAPAAVDATKAAGASFAQAAANIGVEATKQVMPYMGPAIVICAVVHGAVELYPIAQDIKTYVCPSAKEKQDQIASLELAQERVQLIKARRGFRNCLIDNRLNPDRGRSGLPSVCEPLAEAFAALGERKEVDEATAYFNKCREADRK